jgi:hypothetical protein
VTLQNFSAPPNGTLAVYKGTGPADMYPGFIEAYGTVPISGGVVSLTLDPVSITVVQLTDCAIGDTTAAIVTAPAAVQVTQTICQ